MERLKDLRVAAGLRQEDLAAAIGVSRKMISNYENGIGSATVESVKALADYFDISIDFLLGRDEYVNLPIYANTEYAKSKDGKYKKSEIIDLLEAVPQKHRLRLVRVLQQMALENGERFCEGLDLLLYMASDKKESR